MQPTPDGAALAHQQRHTGSRGRPAAAHGNSKPVAERAPPGWAVSLAPRRHRQRNPGNCRRVAAAKHQLPCQSLILAPIPLAPIVYYPSVNLTIVLFICLIACLPPGWFCTEGQRQLLDHPGACWPGGTHCGPLGPQRPACQLGRQRSCCGRHPRRRGGLQLWPKGGGGCRRQPAHWQDAVQACWWQQWAGGSQSIRCCCCQG